MKHHAALLALTLSLTTSLLAAETSNPMGVGAYLMLKAGVNAGSIPEGSKTGVAFNGVPDLGGEFYYPFSSTQNIGGLLDVGYHSYAFVTKPNDFATDVNTFTYKYHYLGISPNFVASILQLGFTFGIPLGYGRTNVDGSVSQSLPSSDVAFLVDAHVGLNAPVFTSPSGRMSVLLSFSYVLTGMQVVPTGGSSTYNPVAASAALGFNYLVNVNQ